MGLQTILASKSMLVLLSLAAIGALAFGLKNGEPVVIGVGVLLFLPVLPLIGYFSLKGMCQVLARTQSTLWTVIHLFINSFTFGLYGFLKYDSGQKLVPMPVMLKPQPEPSLKKLKATKTIVGPGLGFGAFA